MVRPEFRLNDIETLTGLSREKYESLPDEWRWKLMILIREYNLDIYFRDVARELLQDGQKDLTAVYFYSMDALGHSFYKFLNETSRNADDPDFSSIMPNWCWLYDQFIGELTKLVAPDTHIMICSDHGMELALKPQNFLIRDINDPPKDGTDSAAPDISPAPPYETDPFSVKLEYTLPSGQHINAPDGIFVFSGTHVKPGKPVAPVSVTDITPTLLYFLGLPVAEDFDGRALTGLFTDEFIRKHPVKTVTTYETADKKQGKNGNADKTYDDEDALLLNRLKALGYI